MRGLAENRSERQIADESGVAYSTVRSHVTTLKNLTVIWYDEKEAAWISIYPQLPAVSALASLRGCIREKTQANVGADRNLTGCFRGGSAAFARPGRIAFGCFPERPPTADCQTR